MPEHTARILVVDDDLALSTSIQQYFQHEGYAVQCLTSGLTLDTALREFQPNLLILDIMLPGDNGFVLARRVRHYDAYIPILMLSCSGNESDKVTSLELGADYFVTKPVSLRELLAHVRALLRRAEQPAAAQMRNDFYQFGPFTVHTDKQAVFRNDTDLAVTTAEYKLLSIFIAHPNQILSRDELLGYLKGYAHLPADRSVDIGISRLRAKLEDDADQPRYIRTVRGAGYLFCPHA